MTRIGVEQKDRRFQRVRNEKGRVTAAFLPAIEAGTLFGSKTDGQAIAESSGSRPIGDESLAYGDEPGLWCGRRPEGSAEHLFHGIRLCQIRHS